MQLSVLKAAKTTIVLNIFKKLMERVGGEVT